MAEFATALSVASTVLGAYGKQQAGAAADRAASFRADQMEQQAGQERAAAQRAAIEERRQATLANSRVQALAGGGGLDPTIVNLEGNIAAHGEYRAMSALYGGEERALGLETSADAARYEGRMARRAGNLWALGLETSADAARYEGRMARRAGNLGALTSVLSFAGSSTGQSLFEKYGGPTTSTMRGPYADNRPRGQLGY